MSKPSTMCTAFKNTEEELHWCFQAILEWWFQAIVD